MAYGRPARYGSAVIKDCAAFDFQREDALFRQALHTWAIARKSFEFMRVPCRSQRGHVLSPPGLWASSIINTLTVGAPIPSVGSTFSYRIGSCLCTAMLPTTSFPSCTLVFPNAAVSIGAGARFGRAFIDGSRKQQAGIGRAYGAPWTKISISISGTAGGFQSSSAYRGRVITVSPCRTYRRPVTALACTDR